MAGVVVSARADLDEDSSDALAFDGEVEVDQRVLHQLAGWRRQRGCHSAGSHIVAVLIVRCSGFVDLRFPFLLLLSLPRLLLLLPLFRSLRYLLLFHASSLLLFLQRCVSGCAVCGLLRLLLPLLLQLRLPRGLALPPPESTLLALGLSPGSAR